MRPAIAAAFFTQGLVFISLTTRLPRFQERWELGELALSGILLLMVLLSGAGSLVAERLARRAGSARLLRTGLVLAGVAVLVIVLAPHVLVFVLGLASYGIALGLVDASSNMQAVALEHRLGRVVLPSFHGAWTLGGVCGAAFALAGSALPWESAALVAVVPVAAASLPFVASTRSVSGDVPIDEIDVPWRPIMLIGLALVVFYMVDTAAFTWGPAYLEHVLDAPEDLIALAVFPYLVASGLVRLVGDRLTEQVGAVALLRSGAAVAVVALAVVVLAPTWPVAVVGFTLLGGSVAVVAPLSFSAAAALAARDARPEDRLARVDAVIARFNQFNYVGALLGSVLTGLVGSGSLRLGFAAPLVLAFALFPLARAFAPADVRVDSTV